MWLALAPSGDTAFSITTKKSTATPYTAIQSTISAFYDTIPRQSNTCMLMDWNFVLILPRVRHLHTPEQEGAITDVHLQLESRSELSVTMRARNSVFSQVSSADSTEMRPNMAKDIAISTHVTIKPMPPPVEEVQAVPSSTRMAALLRYKQVAAPMVLPPTTSCPLTDHSGR